MDEEIFDLARRVGQSLQRRGWMMVTAESCTGGWIGQALTMVPGSSEWFDRGFITYTNRAKMEMLDVQAATLHAHGAVSEQTVTEMVTGALRHSSAHVAVAVSGVAGPGGGSAAKPVGTVCLGWGRRDAPPVARTVQLTGERDAVRRSAVIAALEHLNALADERS